MKGQLNLDIPFDQRITQLQDPYEISQYYTHGIGFPFERSYYNGKIYSYYGIAPLVMVHLPVYLLTGKIAAPALVNYILATLALISLYWAFTTWYKFFNLRVNLVLFALAIMAIPAVGMLFYVQSCLTHYHPPRLSAMFWQGMLIASAYTAFLHCSQRARNLLLILAGVSVVFIVMSRPHSLFITLAFLIPLFIKLIVRYKNKEQSLTVFNILSAAVPVTIGAIFVMTYNYLRFDSPFEFGQKLCLTAYTLKYRDLMPHIAQLSDVIYHFITPGVFFTENFPFISVVPANLDDKSIWVFCDGNAGVLAYPMNFALFLLVFNFVKQIKKQRLNPVYWTKSFQLEFTYTLLFVLAFIMLAFDHIWNGMSSIGYMPDLAWFAAFAGAFSLLKYIRFTSCGHSKILYSLSVYAFLMSWIVGFLMNFRGNHSLAPNPGAFVEFYNMFRPFAY